MTHHSEVEGLVETLLEELSYGGRKNYLDDTMGMDTARDILRTALTNHSVKVRERLVKEIEAATTHILPLPDDAKDFMGDFERGTVGGGHYVKRIILEAIAPQTDVTKN